MERLSLVGELPARGNVRSSERAPSGARFGLVRMSLAEALALGPAAWDAVSGGLGRPSPFMSWAWHRAWADSAPAAEVAASEALVDFGAGGGVQALLPLQARSLPFHRVPVTALTWAIGDRGCPDLLDLLATPEANVGALVPALAELPWQVLVLSNLAPGAVNAHRLCDAMVVRGWRARRRFLWACPYLDLRPTWDEYLGTLTATRRQTLRRKERNLHRRHAMAITDYHGDRLDEGWHWLVTLHERRWGSVGGGAFRDPSIVHLHRRFAAELSARGQLWLTTLDLDGAPAAAWYGFACGDTVYFYQGGREPRWERESVGLVLMGAMIQRAIERGYRRFDFLRGQEPYKSLWTASQQLTEELTVFRPGWSGRWLRALDVAAALQARFRSRHAPAFTTGTLDDA